MTLSTTCELDMLSRLQHTSGRGTFEAHVTVEAMDLLQREQFGSLCDGLGVKCVLIELPHGITRSQPMTSSYHRGTVAEVVREVADLAQRIRENGFAVIRVKLEAVITNEGVPQTDEDAKTFPSGNYFEFHVKVLLPSDADLDALRTLCKQHGGHLSNNALKHQDDGRTERFVTLRVYAVGRVRAEEVFDRLTNDLQSAGYHLTNRLREYTLYDSNIHVDAGWIDPPVGVGNAGGGGTR